nr:hypothetical protein CPGR_00537 [Mycolicibacterium malmesburyense]
MPVLAGAGHGGPERWPTSQITYRDSFSRAQASDLLVDIAGLQVEVLPSWCGTDRNDLHRLAELWTEPGGQVRMPLHCRVHRIVQLTDVEITFEGDIQLHRVHIVVRLRDAGVKQQPSLQGSQRQHVSDLVMLLKIVDLILAKASGCDVGRC